MGQTHWGFKLDISGRFKSSALGGLLDAEDKGTEIL